MPFYDLARAGVADERLAERAIELVEATLDKKFVEQREHRRLAGAPFDERRDVDGRGDMPREPVSDDQPLALKPPNRRLARRGVAFDSLGAVKARAGAFKLGEHIGTCEAGITGELEVADVVERELPPRAGVFEGTDLDVESPQVGIHSGDRDRSAPGIKKPADVANYEVAELAGNEFPVGCPLRV